MGVVIEFSDFVNKSKTKKIDDAYRLKMLAENKIESYTCNNCGGTIEVVDNNYPKQCPHCGLSIKEWNE